MRHQPGSDGSQSALLRYVRSEEHTSELQSHSDLHSFPTRRSSDLIPWLITLIRAMGRKTMQRVLSLLAIGVCANALVNLSAAAQGTPEVTLTRFECGTSQAPTEVNLRFSDT